MMVTFVSQCEKKALSRTRRVLDAFADRIGDNTWQTVITQEGLLAVKKLLRKTATKNTAVSCHWIRSRKRSELIWVVGSKSKFDSEGRVPVNITEKEVPMDIEREKPQKGVLYANTKLQRLDQHLFAVGYVARELSERFYPNKEPQAKASFIAGCYHDLGKTDPGFQAWVAKDKNKGFIPEDGQHIDDPGKFSFEKHPRHNEISVLLYQLLDDKALKEINRANKNSVRHAIYWHHAKPFRSISAKDLFGSYSSIFKKLDTNLDGRAWFEVVEPSVGLLKRVCELEKIYHERETSILSKCFITYPDSEDVIDGLDKFLPCYKSYEQSDNGLDKFKAAVNENATNNEIRACLITADRWISSLSAAELSELIKRRKLHEFISDQFEKTSLSSESVLQTHIDDCLQEFPDDLRGQAQSDVAVKLASNADHVGVLAGAAGCGKTKIALEWAKLRGAKQILWVCPRVQICQGLFTDLIDSDSAYLPNANVELHTGEFKCMNSYANETDESEYFSGDIVITTIDQLLNTVVSHTKVDRLLNYLSAHVVFDEYHEYISMPAFNLLFAELVASRGGLAGGSKALLVSATPHYLYLKSMLGLDTDEKYGDIVEMPSFNTCKYQFTFSSYDENVEDENNPLYEKQPDATFVISNTAITAQKSFIQNQKSENAILLHSKFKKSDKRNLFSKVFDAFRRDGTQLYDVLRSGPIVQASLNISCQKMVSEVCTAENNLQRLGRLDRFGNNVIGINSYIIAIPDTLAKGQRTGSAARFMSSTNVLSSALAWYQFLLEATDEGKASFTLPELYSFYRNFYAHQPSIKLMEQDLTAAMKKSAQVIADKASEPKVVIKPKKAQKGRARISKSSLRGDSRFVQMAVVDVNEYPNISFPEAYAYEIPTDERENVDNLTASCESIQGYGDSTKNLLAHMQKKHHNIKGGNKAYKDYVLLNEATDPEFPVYLSYTTNDLIAVGGESARHSEAIYYGVCEKQPIGSISIKQITNQKD